MAVKERTLTQEIAWRLADVYAAQTHGNYDEETLFDRGGDWAADKVGKVLSERLAELRRTTTTSGRGTTVYRFERLSGALNPGGGGEIGPPLSSQ